MNSPPMWHFHATDPDPVPVPEIALQEYVEDHIPNVPQDDPLFHPLIKFSISPTSLIAVVKFSYPSFVIRILSSILTPPTSQYLFRTSKLMYAA